MKQNYYFLLFMQLLLISSCSTLTESVDDSILPESYSETYESLESTSKRLITTEQNRLPMEIRKPRFNKSQKEITPPRDTKKTQSFQKQEESILKRKPFTEEILPVVFFPKQEPPVVKTQVKFQKQKPMKRLKRNKKPVKPYKRLTKRHKKSAKTIYQQRRLSVIDPVPQRNLTDILSNYHLGKGDLINIKVFSEEELSMKISLNEEGTISYPFLGKLHLAGFTVNQVEKLITSGLDSDYLVDPKVTVAILEYRQFFVNGEIHKPGGYNFVPSMTINKAISLAGGFTERASRNEIFIIRDGDESATPLLANLETYIGPGDIINIKQYPKFFVDGEVKKAGGYNFLHGLTVNQAISMAGGFTQKASRNEIIIIPKNKEKIAANFNTLVKPGDIVMVKQYKKFFVDGEVKSPASYEYFNGITVKKAISMAGGFTENADRETILLSYQEEKQTQYLVDMNINVEPGDIITIKKYEKIFVNGEVKNTGGYNYAPGLTVDTAISMAGGFTEKADRDSIFIDYQGNEQEQSIVGIYDYVQPGDIITIKSYKKIFVDGEVKNPAAYDYLRDLTVKTAISMAGGFTGKADHNAIFIAHQGDEYTQTLVDLYAPVKSGDVITIKEYQNFFVDGEIKKPGSYSYLRNLTVKTAISMAGGFTEKSARKDIYIIHQGKEQIQVPVNIYTQVKPGDVITVNKYKKYFISGEVKISGGYDFIPGLTVEKAISLAGGFTEYGSAGWSKIYILPEKEKTAKPQRVKLTTAVYPGDIITIKQSLF